MVPAGLRGRGFAHAVRASKMHRDPAAANQRVTRASFFRPHGQSPDDGEGAEAFLVATSGQGCENFLRGLPVVRGQQAVDSSGKGGILAKRGANAPVGDRLDGLSVGPNEDGTGQ